MTTVIHISDTHILPDGYLVAKRLNTVQQLHTLVKYLIQHAPEYGPIDAIILSGDVSDDGSLESYSCFKEIMHDLIYQCMLFQAIMIYVKTCVNPSLMRVIYQKRVD